MDESVRILDIADAPIEEVQKVEFLTMSHLDRMSMAFLEKLAVATHLVIERRRMAREAGR